MLIKEYRIPLPLTVEEYRIAQLYMIAKKSREETKGAGSGVEILVNEPYEDGPGGRGQYTHKNYHVGSHLPGWFKSLLPKSALTVEEEAWNAYPYTKTRYTCPFVHRFSLEIETYYCGDAGHQENVFGLTGSDVRNRVVDIIDVVRDQLHGADYVREEDPRVFFSHKTNRGPLGENWREEYWKECQGEKMPLANGKAIMCAYKLCRVEFHYWGMQSKIEKFIHDTALRKTMLRAHRQAWAWQDEWFGLTMEDIREIERQTAEDLKKMMARADEGNDGGEARESSTASSSSYPDTAQTGAPPTQPKDIPDKDPNKSPFDPAGSKGAQWSRTSSKTILNSPGSSSNPSIELLASWRMESIMRRDSDSCGSEDEFFDCQEDDETVSLNKWSSLDLIPQTSDPSSGLPEDKKDSIFCQPFIQKVTERSQRTLASRGSIEASLPGSPTVLGGFGGTCSTTVLCLVIHAGSALDATMDLPAKKSDVTTFRGAFESVIRQHYPSLMGHVAIKLVPCPPLCTDSLGVLSSLSPYSFEVYGMGESPAMTHESVPIGALPLLATSQHEYGDSVGRMIGMANQVYQDFLKSEEGQGFSGQVIFIGDSMGSILAYDALTRDSKTHYGTDDEAPPSPDHLHAGKPPRRRSSSSSDPGGCKLEFEISDFFMFGSPLGIVLAHRKIHSEDRQMHLSRPCQQVYNLFHPTDPLSTRLEPIISARFASVAPVIVARYAKYPLGDGQPYHLLESIQCNPQLFVDHPGPTLPTLTPNSSRRMSDISIQSGMSGLLDSLPLQAINTLTQKWWGNKRMDYALFCPEALANFPTNSLPHLFHASYWESTDAIAFILRQIGFQESSSLLSNEDRAVRLFTPNQPREKWMKKRTSVKLKNVAANHRGNDVIMKEGVPQLLKARFMYGPLDMVTLTGEKVDIYVMRDPPVGEWEQIATEITDKNGRISYTIPPEKYLGYGIHPVKMIVKGDHTCVDFFCAVVPTNTECIVFSIDGSFTASMSVTGRDPRVRAGAVDVVRHWQELGFIIIYVTGRPDMQQHKVVSWLSQHNFPHGLVSFADGLSTDFLGHKADYLKNLVQEHKICIHAAYGSSKDIGVYTNVGVPPERIYIIGKVSKKQHALATVLSDGYSTHLNILSAHGGSRPAHGNARMVIPRGYFGLPGQHMSMRRRRSAKRTTSYPMINPSESSESTLMNPKFIPRGVSPRRAKTTLSAK